VGRIARERSLFKNDKNQILDKIHQRTAEKKFSGETGDTQGDDEQNENEQYTPELRHSWFSRCVESP
jgi:hypothetical protein